MALSPWRLRCQSNPQGNRIEPRESSGCFSLRSGDPRHYDSHAGVRSTCELDFNNCRVTWREPRVTAASRGREYSGQTPPHPRCPGAGSTAEGWRRRTGPVLGGLDGVDAGEWEEDGGRAAWLSGMGRSAHPSRRERPQRECRQHHRRGQRPVSARGYSLIPHREPAPTAARFRPSSRSRPLPRLQRHRINTDLTRHSRDLPGEMA